MRRIVSSGSAKGIFLETKTLSKRIREAATEALQRFPEIDQVRLFGSLSRGDENGLSDVDLIVVLAASSPKPDPLETVKPYFCFFSNRLDIAVDVLATDLERLESTSTLLGSSVLVAARHPDGNSREICGRL